VAGHGRRRPLLQTAEGDIGQGEDVAGCATESARRGPTPRRQGLVSIREPPATVTFREQTSYPRRPALGRGRGNRSGSRESPSATASVPRAVPAG